MSGGPANFAAKITAGTAGAATATNNFKIRGINGGETWYLGFFRKATRVSGTGTDTVKLQVEWLDATDATISTVDGPVASINGTVAWGYLEAAVVAPANAVTARVKYAASNGAATYGHDIFFTKARFAKTQSGSTLGAAWGTPGTGAGGNISGVPANLIALLGAELLDNQLITDRIFKDEVLDVTEKMGDFARLYADIESRYTDLKARATALGVSTTALDTARTNWRNMVASWGQEAVVNGSGDSVSGWTAINSATLSSVSGRHRVTAPGATFGPGMDQQITGLVVGQIYTVSFELFAGTAGSPQFRLGTSQGGIQYGTATASGSITFTATATTAWVRVMANTTPAAGAYVESDNISLKQNPVTLPWNDTSGDTLIFLNAFADRLFPTGWTLGNSATTVTNGVYTTCTDGSGSLFGNVSRTITQTAAITQYTAALVVKKDAVGKATRYCALRIQFTGGVSKNVDVQFDTSTGEAANNTGSAADAFGILDLGDEWLVWLTASSNVGTTSVQHILFPAVGAGALSTAYLSGTTGSIDVRSALLVGGDANDLGREMLKARQYAFGAELTKLAKAISEKQPVFRGAWLTATAYAVNDVVTSNNTLYICGTAHTSSTAPPNANWTKYTPADQDDLGDGATYVRIPGTNTFGTGTSRRAKVDFTDSHSNKNLDNISDGGTYARVLGSELTSGAHKLGIAGSGKRLGDVRNMPAIASSNLRYKAVKTSDGSTANLLSYSATAGTPATATISIVAVTLKNGDAAANVSYNAMTTASLTGTGGTTVLYHVYVDDAAFAGGTPASGLVASADGTANAPLYSNSARVYLGSISVTFPTSGSGSGSGGDPGGGTCVAEGEYVLTDRGWIVAEDVAPGDLVLVLADGQDGYEWEPVESNERGHEPCYRLTGEESGVSVIVSQSSPITLLGGDVVGLDRCNGVPLPLYTATGHWWECVRPPEPVGVLPVRKIRCGGRTYVAGSVPGKGIATHNPKP
jgi:hypothetical protein